MIVHARADVERGQADRRGILITPTRSSESINANGCSVRVEVEDPDVLSVKSRPGPIGDLQMVPASAAHAAAAGASACSRAKLGLNEVSSDSPSLETPRARRELITGRACPAGGLQLACYLGSLGEHALHEVREMAGKTRAFGRGNGAIAPASRTAHAQRGAAHPVPALRGIGEFDGARGNQLRAAPRPAAARAESRGTREVS